MKVINIQRWVVPQLSRSEIQHEILDVLTEDDIGLRAVYRSIVESSPEPFEDWFLERCAYQGVKLPYSFARLSFPSLPEETYRG